MADREYRVTWEIDLRAVSFNVGDKVIFQHAPGGPEHQAVVTWKKNPPCPEAVLVVFSNGSRQWVQAEQLRLAPVEEQ